jgi:hypothetical protein
MAAIGGTMSGTTCDVKATAIHRQKVQVPSLPLDQLLQFAPAAILPDLVGVYFGGSQHACGILHPTGSCLMRTGRDSYSRFCPVCRYVIVDYVDPEQHWQVDQDYAKEYLL